MNLRKTFFIIPNLFTLASLFCGFFAIATVSSGTHANMGQLYAASIAITFGLFFDMSDGRVARLTKTQSALGLQLDSLADLVTFGVAPAMVMYRWGLDKLTTNWPHVGKYLGLFVAFLFVAAAALRLARFNVLATKEAEEKKGPGKYILGLPVPCAAAVLIGIVGLNYQLGNPYADVGEVALAVLVVLLAYLMVSRVRFRSFKDLRLSRRTVTVVLGSVAGGLLAVFWKHIPSAAIFVTIMAAYVSLGLMEELVFFRRRRIEEAAEKAHARALIPADGGATSDAEVLAELGYGEKPEESDRDEHPTPTPLPAHAMVGGGNPRRR